jgi:hypothetical protein
MGRDAAMARWPSIHRCFRACTGPARVSHVGVMLGRPSAAVRVNVKRLASEDIGSYLGRASTLPQTP